MEGFGKKMKGTVLGATMLIAGAVAGASIPALAGDPPSSTGTAAEAAASPIPLPPVPPEQQGPLFGVVTGQLELTKYDGEGLSLEYDRGRITEIGDGTVTILRFDGQALTLLVDDQTWVREGFRLGSLADLRVGEGAMFFSERTDTGDLHTVLIRCLLPTPFRPPGLGGVGASP